jgi:hypothetical protein
MKKIVLLAVLFLIILTSGCLSEKKACAEGKTIACTVGGCAGTKSCVNGEWGQCVKTNACCGGGCNVTTTSTSSISTTSSTTTSTTTTITQKSTTSTTSTSSTSTTSTNQSGALYPFGVVDPPSENYQLVQELGVTNVRIGVPWEKIQDKKGNFLWNGCGQDQLGELGLTLVFRLRLTEHERASTCPSCIPNPNNPSQCVSLPPLKGNEDCPPSDLSSEWRADGKGYSAILYDFVWEVMRHARECSRPDFTIIVGNEVNTFAFWRGTKPQYLKTRATVYKAAKDFNLQNAANFSVADNGIASTIWGRAVYKEWYCEGKSEVKPELIAQAVEYAKKFERYHVDEATTNENWIAFRENCSNHNVENPGEQEWALKEMFKIEPNLGGPSFDYMDYHFYDPWDTQEEVINWIKAEMQKNGYQKPIVMTEGGIIRMLPCADGANSEEPQCPVCSVSNFVPNSADAKESAQNAVKLNVIALANGVKIFLWLPFSYKEGQYGCELRAFMKGNEKLPLFKSYQTMTSKLNGFTSIQRLPLGEYAYKFTVNGKPVYVLWRNAGTAPNSIQVDLSTEIPGSATVTAFDGSFAIKNHAQLSSLEVTESPIYVQPQT